MLRLLSKQEPLIDGFGGARLVDEGLCELALDMKDRKPLGRLPVLQKGNKSMWPPLLLIYNQYYGFKSVARAETVIAAHEGPAQVFMSFGLTWSVRQLPPLGLFDGRAVTLPLIHRFPTIRTVPRFLSRRTPAGLKG